MKNADSTDDLYYQRHSIGFDIPHRSCDFGEFLSVKPFIPLAQELQQVQVLCGQIEHQEPLPRDV